MRRLGPRAAGGARRAAPSPRRRNGSATAGAGARLRNLACLSLVLRRRAASAHRAALRVKDTVIVFARAPRLGAVKRRLARDIGDRAALRFHPRDADPAACARWPPTAGSARCSRSRPIARVSRLPAAAAAIAQGARRSRPRGCTARAAASRAAGSRSSAATSPTPGRPTSRAAFRALGRADAVFGPAEDGGYWLVALVAAPARAPVRAACAGRASTRSPTRCANFAAGGSRSCARLRDVDTAADLATLRA